ncbi:Clavaminate synthase-like protein [Dendrothele bispora CBS 962.96]|uniref:Clavaminate synthase-like protein n=1 Tax=Dendrothele bispora (strain CBS 962.96) TaxID=1314807 RepID=A0A4S8MRW2_DENBC|nr:Clavaminate synthase-like protein [Dendrothele bispora CBS 962.96]
MPVPTFPPFPDNVPTHPLLVIDYELLKSGDSKEKDRLWTAATKLGFWYLKNHGADEEVNGMFDMGAEMMALPMEEKMKFTRGDAGVSFGYKAVGASAVDAEGNPDTIESLNVSKDDALSYPKPARRTYPRTVNNRMGSTITPFVRKSVDINDTIIAIFNEKLGLPEGTLDSLHTGSGEFSGSETRVIKSRAAGLPADRMAIGAHTDFGSLSFLHNRLGGLQVLPPGVEEWQYVKPLPGHAICNIGDALSIMSGGILRSNIHRVVPPPGDQSKLDRWSLVFFFRPGNSVLLRALTEQSPIIADAVNNADESINFNPGETAEEWFVRRSKYQLLSNRKGPETYMASRGTEMGRV